jgi:hypothetical protein
VREWEPFTEQKLWWFLALNLWMTQHKTLNEPELWSSHWFWRSEGGLHIMPLRLLHFQIIKAELHFQAEDENRDRGEGECQYICKILILMEIIKQIAVQCRNPYYPESNLP